MQIPYLKMQGAGNRILVVDERARHRPPPDPAAIRRLGDPVTGPGFDQLMWVLPAGDERAVASYRVFNADGSEVGQCGNGARCVAWLLSQSAPGRDRFRLASPAGPVDVRIVGAGRIAVSMGVPEFRPRKVPFVAETAEILYELDVDGRVLEVSVLSLGNPHCVLSVYDVATAEVGTLGPLIEHHARFPERTNAGFMHVLDSATINLRVHERGVGETLACGTGACAAAAAARRLGRVGPEVAVNLPGGQLVVSWRASGEPIWLTGNAELTSEGTIDL